MRTDVPRVLIEELRAKHLRMMGNLVGLKRQEPFAPGVEDDGYVARDVPARITAGYGTFRDVADRFGGVTPYTVTVPYDQDVRPGDRWIDEDGNVFNVLAVSYTHLTLPTTERV